MMLTPAQSKYSAVAAKLPSGAVVVVTKSLPRRLPIRTLAPPTPARLRAEITCPSTCMVLGPPVSTLLQDIVKVRMLKRRVVMRWPMTILLMGDSTAALPCGVLEGLHRR
jgi:hypothetical protein